MTAAVELEPGPGERVVPVDEIDTSGVTLDDEPPASAKRHDTRGVLDEKEAINQEIIKGLRSSLESPVFPVLIVRVFNFGGALYDAGLDADMPPLHRLLIGSVVLVIVIGATNPDVMEKIAAKWKQVSKRKAPAHEPEAEVGEHAA